ncbi:NADPH-dependent FMN reductase [Lentiprolixibacter aurantiacus]|uniref:NAD(P)H-dependent oxidoreductase n=1 Tax=Lentiprolixibacter aurantiacus TaxID=2993939 RepID=A0AAE3MLN9_9FLAO|nr:NAD(P)H-dependent oxidoreductase [Lentiprolixibacter aurantiacus]MCX2719734.1 NAD(P)H-dependent oxidoreductase [Lentiprolixibacter aurantiacus]
MAKIIAFAGSNSSRSINFKLVKHTVGSLEGHDVELLNLAEHPFPMYSEDLERDQGFPEELLNFCKALQESDALVLSVNEHNGNPSAYFKNLLDWCSRINRNFLEGTSVFLMSASPGKRGGIGSHGVIEKMLPRFGAEITATFSLPSFHSNFTANEGITDADLSEEHKKALSAFKESIG